ncbi:MAG: neutral zinc metallopeptidase [Pseudomonadota bacterium]
MQSVDTGTSEQRARWFKKGFQAGAIEACDTFKAAQL